MLAVVNTASDRGRVDIDGKQEGANLIVKVASEISPLFFLHSGELFREAAVLRLHLREAFSHRVEIPGRPAPIRRAPFPGSAARRQIYKSD